ncbi:MAG: hypothetical protein HWE27_00555 [Gammaproteobacteria bacterium]|nr:hypothetical protein [Gammaproteobacteria bacterium]
MGEIFESSADTLLTQHSKAQKFQGNQAVLVTFSLHAPNNRTVSDLWVFVVSIMLYKTSLPSSADDYA